MPLMRSRCLLRWWASSTECSCSEQNTSRLVSVIAVSREVGAWFSLYNHWVIVLAQWLAYLSQRKNNRTIVILSPFELFLILIFLDQESLDLTYLGQMALFSLVFTYSFLSAMHTKGEDTFHAQIIRLRLSCTDGGKLCSFSLTTICA